MDTSKRDDWYSPGSNWNDWNDLQNEERALDDYTGDPLEEWQKPRKE